QLAELPRSVLEPNHATHLAVVDSKASHEVNGAIAHVLKLSTCWPTACRWSIGRGRPKRCRRLVWRRWSAYPDARFLIDTEEWAIRGWGEEQFDDGHGFGGELGVAIVHPGVKDGPGGPGDA